MKKIIDQIFIFLKNYFVTIALLLIFVASSYSLFHSSFFHVHDFTHGARIAEMSLSLKEGQFPVRWSNNFGYGFGMPLFNFYAPLPYFIGALFYQLGFNVVGSIKILYFLTNILSLLGAYLLGKKLLGRHGGLLLSVAYTLAPYRAVNLFVRGALSEAFAMAFVPWVLYAVIAFIKKQDKKYLLLLVYSIFGIILSHNLTAMIFIPMAALITFVYLLYLKKIRLIWPIAGTFILAAALSAFYAIPAFMEKDLTKISTIFSGYFHYSHHFLYIRQFFQENWQYGGSAWGPNDGISFFLGFGQLFGLFIFALLFIRQLLKNKKLNQLSFLSFIFGILLLFALLMSTFKTQILWDNFATLQFIQFPWRFLSVVTLFVALLLSISVYFIESKNWRMIYSLVLLFLLLINFKYFKPENYLNDSSALYYDDTKLIQTQMSETLPDYIPTQMAEEKTLLEMGQTLPLAWTESGQENNRVEKMFDNGFEKMIFARFQNEDILNFKVANFIGFKAEIDGESTEIFSSEKLGNIQVKVPKGDHEVAIYFSEDTLARKVGNSISVLAVFTSLYFFYPFAKKRE